MAAALEGAVGPGEGSRQRDVTLRNAASYLVVVLLILLPFVLVGVGPVLYNRYFSIVGRCYTEVLRVETCAEAEAIARQVAERHSNRRDFSLGLERPAATNIYGQKVRGSAYLSLYDVTPFDDVQLGVLCDAQGRIVRRDFIGD